jgi:hypothetical protein
MNCEQCQELIDDLVDGSISQRDEFTLNTHLKQCLDCDSVRQDLTSILSYCQTHRGEYEAPPNEQALWLRIRNVIEAENGGRVAARTESREPSFLGRLMGRTWELSLPQLASLAVAIVLLVSLTTVVGLRRWESNPVSNLVPQAQASNVNDRIWQRRQVINYWNQRVELNKARWSPDMRDAFDRNMKVIDEAVSNSLNELDRNPHDEVAEQMLNQSLNDKLDLLKDFSDL